jgi:DNA polymerase family A
MNNKDISVALAKFLEKSSAIWFKYKPEVENFTIDLDIHISISTKEADLDFDIPDDGISTFIGILQNTIFAKDRIVITWDIKKFFTYLKFRCPEFQFDIQSKIIDLKYSESFLGIRNKEPIKWSEVINRASKFISNSDLRKISQYIHQPLVTEVLPAIETFGLINQEDSRWDYCYYELEEHINGRLKCKSLGNNFYLPHSWRQEKKSKYSPGYEKKFIIFDYLHMEVSVFQWLSGDKVLGDIIKSGKDVYAGIYQILSNKQCTSDTHRQFVKNLFLPVVFGMQSQKLASQLDISQKGAESLISKIYENFPTAMTWVEKQQGKFKESPFVSDCLGRVRKYEESYKIRSAVIQSPAAVICLEKLVLLHYQCKKLKLIASIHDAFVGIVEDKAVDYVVNEAKQLLESPSEFAPGLSLKVNCEIGSNLNELRRFNEFDFSEFST